MIYPKDLKKTKGRLMVFNYFKNLSASISVEELHEIFPEIHLATLYRIVDEFSKHSIIRLSDDFNPQVRRYEKNENRHLHKIKCIDCKKELTLESCPLHLHAPAGFIILDHRIEIEGLCQECAQKREKK